jgi:Mrr N-terminal domain
LPDIGKGILHPLADGASGDPRLRARRRPRSLATGPAIGSSPISAGDHGCDGGSLGWGSEAVVELFAPGRWTPPQAAFRAGLSEIGQFFYRSTRPARGTPLSIPDFQTLMLPVLQSAAKGEVRISDVVERLADKFGLSSEERAHLLPSGRQTTFSNRVHWAKSSLGKAGLVELMLCPHRLSTSGPAICARWR